MSGEEAARDELQGGRMRTSSIYEIFILFLGISSLITLIALLFFPLPVHFKLSLLTVGNATSIVFLADFFRSLRRASDRKAYFKKWGWLDLLGGIPGFPILRLARTGRIVRAGRYLRAVKSSEVTQDLMARPAQNTLLATIIVSLLAFLVASSLVVELEQGAPGANIKTADEGIWWAFVTVTTVGFGDYYPVTSGGRILAAGLMSVGVGVFGVLTSYLARSFLRHGEKQTSADLAAIRDELADLRRLLEERDGPSRDESAAGGASEDSSLMDTGGENAP